MESKVVLFGGSLVVSVQVRSLNGTHFEGIKQCKCMVNFWDFPCHTVDG